MKVAGGIRIDEPGIDLAVDLPSCLLSTTVLLKARTGLFSEIGLSGEVRMVSRMEDRVKEAQLSRFSGEILVPVAVF